MLMLARVRPRDGARAPARWNAHATPNMIRKIILVLLGLALTATFALNVVGVTRLPFLDLLEFSAYDARVRLTSSGQQDPRILVIDIDEKSIAAEGRWPWRRDVIAKLVERLVFDYQVEVVAFDMVFPEKEENFSVQQLRELALGRGDTRMVEDLARYEHELDRDAIFAEAIARTGRVVLGFFLHHDPEENRFVGALPAPQYPADSGMQFTTFAIQSSGYAGNLETLQAAAASAGFFSNPVVDDDGVYRRVPLVAEHQGDLYVSLALAAAQAYLGIEAEPVFAPGGDMLGDYPALEGFDLAGVYLPIDANATALVPYIGPEGSFPYVSATDVLRGAVEDPQRLAGTIALIGTTAAGLVDLRPTPVQNVYPGVEVHANLIAGMLDGTIRQQPAYTLALELLILLLAGIVLSVALPLTGPLTGGLATFATAAVIGGINVYAWESLLHVLPLASATVMVLLIYVLNVVFGFFFEARSRNQLGRLFGQYVPPELVDEMSRDPGHYSLAGAKRELTVLFSDVRNFTDISESMDPEELTHMMGSFLTPLTGSVHRHKGTIDKYMGDALMAFWGAPVDDEQHASHAVAAALDMLEQIDQLAPLFERNGWHRLTVGIGINSGEMSVGNMGSQFRVAYTVMGDAVNLGSRLEGLTKHYGVPLIVGETTAERARDYDFLALDQVRVKGKQQPVGIFLPLGLASETTETTARFVHGHETALADYRARRFQAAQRWFAQAPAIDGLERLYTLYRERIDHCLANPPGDDWDGVFVLDSK